MNKNEILDILNDTNYSDALFQKADKIRHETVGDAVHLRGLIEFSNICKRRCQYCGLQATNTHIERYRLSPERLIEQAKIAAEIGYKTVVLQSGEDDYYSREIMCRIVHSIKKFNLAITLSIGEKSFDDYKAYRDNGADRYLLRIETTDKKLYQSLHPGADYDNRVRCLENLKKLGYEVGTGCLVGLPNQTKDSLANDILFFKEVGADMVGIGPLIPHKDTPLKNAKQGNFLLTLKVMALTRILLPHINIPATTAMENVNPNGRLIALQSGANVVMPNMTPLDCCAKYEIYPRKIERYEFADKYKTDIEAKIKSIGRTIATDFGNARKHP